MQQYYEVQTWVIIREIHNLKKKKPLEKLRRRSRIAISSDSRATVRGKPQKTASSHTQRLLRKQAASSKSIFAATVFVFLFSTNTLMRCPNLCETFLTARLALRLHLFGCNWTWLQTKFDRINVKPSGSCRTSGLPPFDSLNSTALQYGLPATSRQVQGCPSGQRKFKLSKLGDRCSDSRMLLYVIKFRRHKADGC